MSIARLNLRWVITVISVSLSLVAGPSSLANDSFGPPVLSCGKDGAEPCGDEKKIDATLIGNAEKWGCKGKNLYFTPHNGGQC